MQYISLGCDCSNTYQLRKYGLQTMGTMPFDWMKLDKLQDLIAILDNNFTGFEKFDNYTVKSQSDNFVNMDLVNMGSEKVLSRRKLIHNKYKFILPHEYMNDILDIEQFEAKYARRIIRFHTMVTDSSIKKIFVRLCGDKETREKSNYVKNKIYLEECLARYGCVNFKVIVINYNDYDSLIPDKYTWQRDYIPWSEVLELDLQ